MEVENVVTSNTVWLNISDDKQGLAKYLSEKLPEMCDDKSYLALNTAELLPNMCDNHHVGFHSYWDCDHSYWEPLFKYIGTSLKL